MTETYKVEKDNRSDIGYLVSFWEMGQVKNVLEPQCRQK